jgi:hypothetical protein
VKDRFVVLVDFSPHSSHVVNFAHEWSRRVGAEILLVHSTFAPLPAMASHESKRQIADIANSAALEKLERLAGFAGKTPVTFLASEKSLVAVLNKLLQGRM